MKNPIIALSLIASLTACIGGEDGLPDYYTEATTDATVTSDNAEKVVDEVVGSLKTTSSFGDDSNDINVSFKALHSGIRASRATTADDALGDLGSLLSGDPIEGDCGGTTAWDISETSVNISYNDYCTSVGELQWVMDGYINTSGSGTDTSGNSTTKMNLTTTFGTDVSKAAGTLKTTWDGSTTTYVMDFTASESKSGDSVKLSGFTIEEDADEEVVAISGDVCSNKIEGCVTVSTPTKFEKTADGDYSAGSLEIKSGTSVVKIDVTDTGTCDLILDDETLDTQDCTDYLP